MPLFDRLGALGLHDLRQTNSAWGRAYNYLVTSCDQLVTHFRHGNAVIDSSELVYFLTGLGCVTACVSLLVAYLQARSEIRKLKSGKP